MILSKTQLTEKKTLYYIQYNITYYTSKNIKINGNFK